MLETPTVTATVSSAHCVTNHASRLLRVTKGVESSSVHAYARADARAYARCIRHRRSATGRNSSGRQHLEAQHGPRLQRHARVRTRGRHLEEEPSKQLPGELRG